MRRVSQQVGTAAWGLATLLGVASFALILAGLHFAQPELDPSTVAVSYYVHGAHGHWLTVGLLSLGTGSLALVQLLRQTLHVPGAALVRWSVGVWGACVLAATAFPTDPWGRWSDPSVGGTIHGGAALVGFVALPLAALTLQRSLRHDPAWRAGGAHLPSLGILCGVSLLAFCASLWPTIGADRAPFLLGLSERVLLATYLAWLSASAWQGLRVATAQ